MQRIGLNPQEHFLMVVRHFLGNLDPEANRIALDLDHGDPDVWEGE
jgi:hypothetical protein